MAQLLKKMSILQLQGISNSELTCIWGANPRPPRTHFTQTLRKAVFDKITQRLFGGSAVHHIIGSCSVTDIVGDVILAYGVYSKIKRTRGEAHGHSDWWLLNACAKRWYLQLSTCTLSRFAPK